MINIDDFKQIDPLDALGICQCKDCIHLWHDANNDNFCAYKNELQYPKETDYCPYAEKRMTTMFDFENKPVKDWTLAEVKEYCKAHCTNEEYCLGKDCTLRDTESCTVFFTEMELKDNTIIEFTHDEIAFCRLLKKTCPWANYIARSSITLVYLELQPVFTHNGYFESGRTGRYTKIDEKFFPQIKPLAYYAIDDIIKLGDDNNA